MSVRVTTVTSEAPVGIVNLLLAVYVALTPNLQVCPGANPVKTYESVVMLIPARTTAESRRTSQETAPGIAFHPTVTVVLVVVVAAKPVTVGVPVVKTSKSELFVEFFGQLFTIPTEYVVLGDSKENWQLVRLFSTETELTEVVPVESNKVNV